MRLPNGPSSCTRERELPHLVADRCAPVALVVAIPRRDLGDEMLERIGRTTRADHDGAVLDGDFHAIALIHLRLQRDRLREAQSQTVAPLCNLRSRGHVSTLSRRSGISMSSGVSPW